MKSPLAGSIAAKVAPHIIIPSKAHNALLETGEYNLLSQPWMVEFNVMHSLVDPIEHPRIYFVRAGNPGLASRNVWKLWFNTEKAAFLAKEARAHPGEEIDDIMPQIVGKADVYRIAEKEYFEGLKEARKWPHFTWGTQTHKDANNPGAFTFFTDSEISGRYFETQYVPVIEKICLD